jgi:hypothetical protein
MRSSLVQRLCLSKLNKSSPQRPESPPFVAFSAAV